MELDNQNKSVEYFSFWNLQNKITLISLSIILILSATFAVVILSFPEYQTRLLMTYIIAAPMVACFGFAACYSSLSESRKALSNYEKLTQRLSETEASEITLDRFFSISSDLMAVAGKNGYLKKVSASLIATLGYSESVLLTTPFFDFIHPDDRDTTLKQIDGLKRGLRSVGFENRYRAFDGSYKRLSWSAAADKELGVRFASARDVTEERNLQFRLQQILDSAPFLFLEQNEKGIIINCNSAAVRALGVPRDQIIGRNHEDLLTPDSVQSTLEKERQIISDKMAQSFEENLLVHGASTRYLSTVFPVFDQVGEVNSIGRISVPLN